MGGADDAEDAPLRSLDWSEIDAPGCYLLVVSGLLARVYPDELVRDGDALRMGAPARVVRLSDNPAEPLQVLRTIAERHRLRVNF